MHCSNKQQNMIESSSYHTNTVAEFTVCYNVVHLTTDNIFVNPRNKIYEHIYVSRKEPRKYMRFKQALPWHTNLNWSLHPLHPSERKQACYSLSKLLPTQEQQESSPHERLSRVVDSGGCTPNPWHHHGHKPESSCQPLGRRGFCMATLVIWVSGLWAGPSFELTRACPENGGQITITYHYLAQDALHV